jgi:hypothetical protein
VTYTPAKGFEGTDTFTYEAGSSGGTATAATVTVTVPPPPPTRLTPLLNWGFESGNAQIASMVATGVINGAKIEITCSGKGCRFKSHSSTPPTPKPKCKKGKPCPKPKESTTDSLTSLFKGWRFGKGATLTVSVEKSGAYIAKVYVFSFRPPASVQTKITCLAPGQKTLGKDC